MKKLKSAIGILLAVCLLSGCGMHTHVYENDCDKRCNVCGAEREVYGHLYSGDCDTVCNSCGEVRAAKAHTYTSDCDTVCDCCGEARVANAEHFHEDKCALYCDLCGSEMENGGHNFGKNYKYNYDATHSSNGTESKTCTKCGYVWETRVVENSKGHCFDKDGRCTDCGWSFPDLSLYMAYESFEAIEFYNVSYYTKFNYTRI